MRNKSELFEILDILDILIKSTDNMLLAKEI